MIEARGLVKRYGSTTAVDHLSFDVQPGTVTGFLGPNGAGKSTTMRMILGLDRPDAGTARVNGKSYHDLRWPFPRPAGPGRGSSASWWICRRRSGRGNRSRSRAGHRN